jgi:hypothetical protein
MQQMTCDYSSVVRPLKMTAPYFLVKRTARVSKSLPNSL